MDIANIVELVNQYGIPVVVAVGMGYFIFYIWKFVTNNDFKVNAKTWA